MFCFFTCPRFSFISPLACSQALQQESCLVEVFLRPCLGLLGSAAPTWSPQPCWGEKPARPKHREVTHPVSVLRGILFPSQTPLWKPVGKAENLLKPCPMGLLRSGAVPKSGGKAPAFLELCVEKLKPPRPNLQRCSGSIAWGQYCLANLPTVFIQVFFIGVFVALQKHREQCSRFPFLSTLCVSFL